MICGQAGPVSKSFCPATIPAGCAGLAGNGEPGRFPGNEKRQGQRLPKYFRNASAAASRLDPSGLSLLGS